MLPDLVCLWVGKYDVCTVDVANRLDAGCVKAGVIVVCLGESIHESPTLEQIDIEQNLEPPSDIDLFIGAALFKFLHQSRLKG